jgi:hypothetical protein
MEKKPNDATETMKPYISLVEASRLLGLRPKTLRNWKWAGKLTPKHGLRKVGSRVKFDIDQLKAAVDSGDLAA